MTPTDNAILSEMLDNALSDIKYLRQEVAALREAKALAMARADENAKLLLQVLDELAAARRAEANTPDP